jgi:hypothetical protein
MLEVVSRTNTKHGMRASKEYVTWESMRARCSRQSVDSFPSYGGRGISVCKRWDESFEAFFADMGPKPTHGHSIDRIDTNGDYEPGNCRWATASEQAKNRRNSIALTAFGERKPLLDWLQDPRCVVPETALRKRVSMGFAHEDAIAVPKRMLRGKFHAAKNAIS